MSDVQMARGGVNSTANPSDSVYRRLLKEHIIWLGGEVHSEDANAIYIQMFLLVAEDTERDIYLYIDSPGDSVIAGIAIHDTIQCIEPDIVTVETGLAASMGQFLLITGTPDKYYITPRTCVLFHQPLGGAGGSTAEIRINADLILKMKKELTKITAQYTSKFIEQIEVGVDHDHWLSTRKALKYGFASRVIEIPQEIGHRVEEGAK